MTTGPQYIVAAPHNVGRLPDFVSFEQGATIGVGCVAAASALFDSLMITPNPPWKGFASSSGHLSERDRPWIIIWGASCVTGMMITQLARQSGFRVFAVAGIHNTAELHSLGAEVIFDRHKPQEAIAQAQKYSIRLAVDCVGQETASYAVQAMQEGGKMAYLVKGPKPEVVEEKKATITDILIKRFHEDERYGQALANHISQSLLSRSIRPVKLDLVDGGFGGLENGLKRLKNQEVSGRKLVVRVEMD